MFTECHLCGDIITPDEHGQPCDYSVDGHEACSVVCD